MLNDGGCRSNEGELWMVSRSDVSCEFMGEGRRSEIFEFETYKEKQVFWEVHKN